MSTTEQPHTPQVNYVFSEEAIHAALPIVQGVGDPTITTLTPYERASRTAETAERLAPLLSSYPFTLEALSADELDIEQAMDELNVLEALRATTQARLNSARDRLQVIEERTKDIPGHFTHEPMGPKDRISDSEIVERLEGKSPAKRMPKFADQVRDTSRTGTFQFEVEDGKGRVIRAGSVTEHKGLRDLWEYCRDYVKISNRTGFRRNERLIADVRSIMDNLNFIGKKEYYEAARGLGVLWKTYLDADPNRKICVLTEVGKLERYSGMRKSDEYLRDQILETFTDEELAKYSGRIVGNMADLRDNNPADTRVIMLDDWTISGKQIRDEWAEMEGDPHFEFYRRGGSIEINVLIASEDRIKNGLALDPYNALKGSIPLRAYFVSHNAKRAQKEQKAHITGVHSSVNYDFECVLRQVRIQRGKKAKGLYPALASVKRSYRDSRPTMSLSRYALMRVPYAPSYEEGRVYEP